LFSSGALTVTSEISVLKTLSAGLSLSITGAELF
jgi:hypothetical protein